MFFEDIFSEDDPNLFDMPLAPLDDDDPLAIVVKNEMEEEDLHNNYSSYIPDDFLGVEMPEIDDNTPHIPQTQYIHPPPMEHQNQIHQQQHIYDHRSTLNRNDSRYTSRSTSPTDSHTSEGSLASPSEEESSLSVPPPPSSTPSRRKKSNNKEDAKARKRRKRKRHEIEEDTQRLGYLRNKKNKSESEKAELRKLRNRDSAMRSRAKKAKEMQSKDQTISNQRLKIRSLEEDVECLRREVDNMGRENAFLKQENRRLHEKLKFPNKIYSAALLLVLFLILGFILCKSPFIFPTNYVTSLVANQPLEDDIFNEDYLYSETSYRDPLGFYEWEMEDPVKALPGLEDPSSRDLVMSDKTTDNVEYVYIQDENGQLQRRERNVNMCYFSDSSNGMIPVDQKVKKSTVKEEDPLFSTSHLLKERELTFSEEMYHHFVSNPQYVFVNSENFDPRQDLPKRRITSVPPAATTGEYIYESNYGAGRCATNSMNGSKNSNDTIFIEDEEDAAEILYAKYQEQELHNQQHRVKEELEDGDEEEEMQYRYLRKNESGEIVGYYYSSEDWDNKEVFMTPHIFHLNGNQAFQDTAAGGIYNEEDIYGDNNNSNSFEDEEDKELILVFPVEMLRGKNGENTGVFKLAEIHIPSKAVHFGESFWSFQPLKADSGRQQ